MHVTHQTCRNIFATDSRGGASHDHAQSFGQDHDASSVDEPCLLKIENSESFCVS